MKRAQLGPRSLVVGAAVLGLLVFMASPVSAQTGQVKGRVVDAQGQPLEGAKITIEYVGALSRRHETKTDKKGNFVQIGLQSGSYRVTASKDNMSQSFEARVRIGVMAEVNFVLAPGTAAGMSKEEAAARKAKFEAAEKTFNEAVALSQAGQDDDAIAKFTEVNAQIENKCAECLVNVGAIHTKNKRYDEAEKAYKAALEVNPEQSDAFNGLANVYNAQKKFDEAAKMSGEAAKLVAAKGGGSASAVFNQGVSLWNAGKIQEAKTQFEEALKLDPNYADAHFLLGKAHINLGQLKEAALEFETYLRLAPDGPNAKEAQTNFDLLKPYIK